VISTKSGTMVDRTERIEVNDDPKTPGHFFKLSGDEQAATLWHEMLHNNFPGHAKKPKNQPFEKTIESDRTWACENLCFGTKSTGLPPTKCSCDKCLGPRLRERPPGQKAQKCNVKCLSFAKCNDPKGEKRCKCPKAGCPAKPAPGNLPGKKIYCFCNNTCYNTATDCTSQCKATLACFTGICGPAQPGQC
jgi:hypothetical protein